jgi:hypothetical protein
MDRSQANAQISHLGQDLGLPDLALDEGGVCMITVGDDALVVSLGHDAAGGVRVMVCLNDVTPAGAQLAELMAANFGGAQTEGGTFALAPVTGALVLQRRCGTDDLQAGGLTAVVVGLATAARAWRARLQEKSASSESHTHMPFTGERA